MAKKRADETLDELVRKLIIVQLGLARVPQQAIRKIVGGDINSVNSIVKHLRVRNRVERRD